MRGPYGDLPVLDSRRPTMSFSVNLFSSSFTGHFVLSVRCSSNFRMHKVRASNNRRTLIRLLPAWVANFVTRIYSQTGICVRIAFPNLTPLFPTRVTQTEKKAWLV